MEQKQSCFRTIIGGQALIEGILMRGPDTSCIVVRKPDGTLVTKTTPLKPPGQRHPVLRWPFVRGVYSLGSALKDGVTALFYAAELAFDEPEAEEKPGFLERRLGKKKADELLMGFAGVMGVALPIVLFFLLPTLLAGFFNEAFGSGILRNLIEGLIRLLLFFVFMLSVSRMKEIRRTFHYHGAEHKSIHCYERGLPLTVENVQSFPKEHPRCGTSFLLVVMLVSILVFSCVSWSNPLIRLALRLLLLPVVVAISYEINRAVGRYDNPLTRVLRAPGLWLQRLTTLEPDNGMAEVAIAALREVIPAQGGSDRW